MCYNNIKGKGGRIPAMEEQESEEMTGKEIARFMELQAKEGKTAEEAIEALMAVVGGEMPEFKKA